MKYFGFLARFVAAPLLVLLFLAWRDRKRGKTLPPELRGLKPEQALAGLSAVAVAWTTPWDNYLVASKVWWYDPRLVTGVVLGYVPIEEYTFFVLQTLFTGSWVLFLARSLKPNPHKPRHPMLVRLSMAGALGLVWGWAVWNLLRGPKARTYLSLTLSWALLPLIVQALFGGDILWQHRRLIALGFIPTTVYLSVADSLAIEGGTWTINPDKTIPIKLLGGNLPFEEGLFFLLTNLLISMGMTLVMATESRARVPTFLRRYLPPMADA
jgi:lycopene cyclase domain-containing protein